MILKRFSTVATAGLFTTFFLLVGWKTIAPFNFTDLERYRVGFESKLYLFRVINLDPIRFVLSEGVWVYLFDDLYNRTGNIDLSFNIISFICVVLCSTYIISKTKSAIYTIFLINPAFVNLGLEQIRSGLGAGLFFISLTVKNRILKSLLLFLSMCMHTVFFLVGSIYIIYLLFDRTKKFDIIKYNKLLTLSIISAISILIVIFREVILSSIGDRRAYSYFEQTSGIYLSVAWLTFIVTHYIYSKRDKLSFEACFFTFCVITMASSLFFGIYGARFVALAIPALAVMASEIAPNRQPLFFAQYIGFSGIYFFLWLQ